MYLSRVPIDPKNRKSLIALSNPEILHGMLESCFPNEQNRKLWRIDQLNGQTYLLLLSQDKPDLSSLTNQIGFQDTGWESRDYQPLLERIQTGSIWQFRLAVNPVTNVPQSGGNRGKVKAVTIVSQQRDWLIQRAKKYGFLLAPDQFDSIQSEWKVFNNKGHRVSLFCVTYEGLLSVLDPDVFTTTLLNGIGHGKAYGMGLLTIMSKK